MVTRASAAAAVLLLGCGDNLAPGAEPIQNPVRDAYDTWIKVEPPGVTCGDGSPYKMFVNYSNQSDNLVVVFEPGGACWDYDSCAGRNGIRVEDANRCCRAGNPWPELSRRHSCLQ